MTLLIVTLLGSLLSGVCLTLTVLRPVSVSKIYLKNLQQERKQEIPSSIFECTEVL